MLALTDLLYTPLTANNKRHTRHMCGMFRLGSFFTLFLILKCLCLVPLDSYIFRCDSHHSFLFHTYAALFLVLLLLFVLLLLLLNKFVSFSFHFFFECGFRLLLLFFRTALFIHFAFLKFQLHSIHNWTCSSYFHILPGCCVVAWFHFFRLHSSKIGFSHDLFTIRNM